MVNGLDPNGFSSLNWIQGGKQGMFETAIMTSPAFAGRLEFSGISNFRVGLSGYYNKTAKNASKAEKTSTIDAPVTIGTCDAQYLNQRMAIRANLVYGHLGDAYELYMVNKNISKNTNFSRTVIGNTALTYSLEAGYDILSLFHSKEKLMPFARYEYYNSTEKMDEGMAEIPMNKSEVVSLGINYYLLPNLVFKADYSMRIIDSGNFNQENTIGLALAYTGWFTQK